MSDSLVRSVGRDDVAVMNRSELTGRLATAVGDEVAIVAGIGNTHFDLWASGQRPANFYMLGSMGLAVPIALGVAVAQPERPVVCVEGDGSILMQLGALGTVATVAPPNLTVVVWDNGAYQITGGQQAMTSTTLDLVAVARGAGIEQSTWVADADHFDALVANATTGNGPVFACARVDAQPPAGVTERDASRIGNRFMDAMALPLGET
jgi:thiamine pyrophosphate-dependent acetolactate synthase large subunit-like protein